MIYITWDCHGDYLRFSTEKFPEQKQMTKEDYVIIAGDFGFWKNDREQYTQSHQSWVMVERGIAKLRRNGYWYP